MKIFYCCFGGSHSSVTAAAIHLGILSPTRIPTAQELMKVPFFEQQTGDDHGKFYLMGQDEFGNQVYIIGKHNLGRFFESLIRQVAGIWGVNQEKLVIVDTMPYVNYLMMVGGYTSRRLGVSSIGQPLVIKGTQKAFFKLVNLVERIKTTTASKTVRHPKPG